MLCSRIRDYGDVLAKLNASVTGLHYKTDQCSIRNYWFVSYTSINKTQFDRAKEQIKLKSFCFIEKQNKTKKKNDGEG